MRNLRIEARDPNTPASRLKELLELNWRLASEVAHNPSATGELLSHAFSRYSYNRLREQIIKHPNCPTALLLKEGPRHSSSLMENPALPLLLLEDPNFYAKLELRNATHQLMTARLPESLLALILNRRDEYLASCLIYNPHLSAEHIETAIEQLKNKEAHWEKIAQNPQAPRWFLERYAWDKLFNLRLAVAKNPSTPAPLLLEMTQYETGANKRLSVLHKPPNVSKDQSISLRLALAQNPSAPAEALSLLSRDLPAAIRAHTAKHPNTPEADLMRLSLEESLRLILLRREVLPNALLPLYERVNLTEALSLFAPNDTPPRLWESLTNEEPTLRAEQFWRMLASALSHQRGEPSPKLQGASWAELADVCIKLQRPQDNVRAERFWRAVMLLLVRHPALSIDQLAELAQSPDEQVRRAVAQSPQAPGDVLARLCADERSKVRTRAALHPNAPRRVLELMYKAGASFDLMTIGAPRDELTPEEKSTLHGLGPFTERLVAKKQSEPMDPLTSWFWTKLRGALSMEEADIKALWLQAKLEENANTLVACAAHENPFIRARVAVNPNLTDTQRKELSLDKQWFVRLAVVLNPNVSPSLLTAMLKDKDLRVRRMIAKHNALPEEARAALLQDTQKKVRRSAASMLSFPVIKKRPMKTRG